MMTDKTIEEFRDAYYDATDVALDASDYVADETTAYDTYNSAHDACAAYIAARDSARDAAAYHAVGIAAAVRDSDDTKRAFDNYIKLKEERLRDL